MVPIYLIVYMSLIQIRFARKCSRVVVKSYDIVVTAALLGARQAQINNILYTERGYIQRAPLHRFCLFGMTYFQGLVF